MDDQKPMKKYRQSTTKLFIILSLLAITGCQMPLANHARDEWFPQDNTKRLILSPILLPGYMLFCFTDIFLVNPIRGSQNVPETMDSLWSWKNDRGWLGLGLLLPVKLVATPPAALGTAMFSEQFSYYEPPHDNRFGRNEKD